jgi:RHS repeat-associated protein
MTKMRSLLFAVSAIMVLTFALPSFAQVLTGAPPHSVAQGAPDKVDPANLNVHFTVPIINNPGRKIPMQYSLKYDSSLWTPVTVGYTTTWQPSSSTWGWTNENSASTGHVTFAEDVYPCWGWYYYYEFQEQDGTDVSANNFVYVDPSGTPHPFNSAGYAFVQYGGDSQCPDEDSPSAGPTTASDGSGYVMQSVDLNTSNVNITTPSGTVISVPIWSSPTGSITDTNGNMVSNAYVYGTGQVFTDTLGNSALTIAGSGTASSPNTYTYTAPSGASAVYTEKYTNYNIQTNFGCSVIGEYSASSVPLVTEIDLPDQGVHSSDKYTFTYEVTPGYTGYTTGRIASVTFPTGGTIYYAYSGGSNGITCSDGSTATLTRTTPDTGSNYWTYAHSESGTAWTTTITDPTGNQTVMNFQGVLPTETQIYSGTSGGGTLLKTIYTCYNGSTPNCNATAVTQPISSKATYIQWPGSGGLESKTVTSINGYGLVTETDEYGYGSGSPGSLIRKTLTTYNTSLTNNILDRPSQVTIEDGSSSVKAQTTYSYDGTGVTSTSGTPQHVSITGSRGNVTTIASLVSGTTTLNKTFAYYDTGNVSTVTDVNSATFTLSYGTGSCGNSFPTSISEPLSMSRSITWNCTGGVPTAVTDENGNSVSASYTDPYYWRPASTTDAASNGTTYTYSPPFTEIFLPINSSSSVSDTLMSVDSLGRNHVSQGREGYGTSYPYDSVETDYDSLGRPYRITLPYSTATPGATSSSAPGTNTTYDPLGRKTGLTDSGGLSVSFSYSQNDALKTAGPAPTGENTKKKQYEYDALGRLTSVCEVTSLTGSGTCGQTNSQTGYWTEYTYDVNNHLTGVTQNAQASSMYQQTRSVSYDDLGRMTSETHSESGTTNYVYDTDSTCGTSSGDLVKATDAVGNVTCYAYDALHRVTSTTYPSGSYASVTPSRYFVYDSATVNSVSMSNAKTHLAEAYTCTSCPGTKITDVGFSYTARGEPSDAYESTPHSSGYYHVSASYWPNGVVHQLSGLSGLPTITYGVDSKGRGYSVSASSGQNPVSSVTYNTASEITQINFGSSDSDSFSYDSNTNRMTQYSFDVNGSSMVGALTWNAIGTLSGLTVTDPFYSGGNETCSYTHDDLTRIAGVNCGSVWSQTFSFDAFGNINKSGSSSFGATYAPSSNRMTVIGSSTPTYDSNGNVTNDFLHTYAWDSNGRPVTIDSVGATYNALGQMVEQNRSSTYTEIVYDPSGGKLALMSGSTLQKAYVQLPDGAMAVYNSSGLAYYRHTDWIGSSRLAATPARAVYYDGAYAPYGEPYAKNGTDDLSFTGMNQDTVTNLYDFPTREYGIQGRWPSPDPAGLSSMHLKDPQTLNRYAYARNNPLALVDPTGEDECDGQGDDCDPGNEWSFCPWCEYEGGGGGGGGAGGGDTGTSENVDPGGDPGLISGAGDDAPLSPIVISVTSNLWVSTISCDPSSDPFQCGLQENTISYFLLPTLDSGGSDGSGGGGGPSVTASGGESAGAQIVKSAYSNYTSCVNSNLQASSGTSLVQDLLKHAGGQSPIGDSDPFKSLAEGALDAYQDCANKNPVAILDKSYQGPIPRSESTQSIVDWIDSIF